MRKIERTILESGSIQRNVAWGCDVAHCESHAEILLSISASDEEGRDEGGRSERTDEDADVRKAKKPRGWIERAAPPRGTSLDLCPLHAPLEALIDGMCDQIPDICHRIANHPNSPDSSDRTGPIRRSRSLDPSDAPRIAWGAHLHLRAAHTDRTKDDLESIEDLTILSLSLADRVLALEAALESATQMLRAETRPTSGNATAPSPRVREIQIRALESIATSGTDVLSIVADRALADRSRRKAREANREAKRARREELP